MARFFGFVVCCYLKNGISCQFPQARGMIIRFCRTLAQQNRRILPRRLSHGGIFTVLSYGGAAESENHASLVGLAGFGGYAWILALGRWEIRAQAPELARYSCITKEPRKRVLCRKRVQVAKKHPEDQRSLREASLVQTGSLPANGTCARTISAAGCRREPHPPCGRGLSGRAYDPRREADK